MAEESAIKWRKRLDEESKKERRAILQCFAVGVLLNGVVLAAGLMLGEIAARVAPRPRAEAYLIGVCFAAGICVLMLVVATFTKPEGRAETARRIFTQATDQALADDHPAEGLAYSLALIIALYAGFSIVEASKRTCMCLKLAKVDRDQTARILAQITDTPVGVAWRSLLESGQTFESLRGPVALLMLDGWIQLVDRGRTLAQRTPAMRKLMYRHPLAEVFSVGG